MTTFLPCLRAILQSCAGKKRLRASVASQIGHPKATNILRTDDDRDWPETLEDHLLQIAADYPAMAESLRYFYRQSCYPHGNTELFITNLRLFKIWFNDICYHSK